ncbi:unnamed protein product, partial [Effrenium voratum]
MDDSGAQPDILVTLEEAGIRTPWQAALALQQVGGESGYRAQLRNGRPVGNLAKGVKTVGGSMSRVDLAIRDAVRSIERGIGGPALKDGFRFEQVTLSLDSKSATKKAAIFTLGVWFLLREIELAALQVKHVAVDEANTIVTVSLSCSKMDTVEQSVHRSHKCYCSYAVLFHARGNHYEEMSKEETISIIREVLGASNIPLLRRGAPLSFIVLMGLRGSRAVERYVQEAQLE